MSDKDLSNMPHHINGHEDVWWYESPKGIDIINRHVNQYGQVKSECATIPWRYLRNALKRKDKP